MEKENIFLQWRKNREGIGGKDLDNENILDPFKSDPKMNPLSNNPSENSSSSLKMSTAVLPFLVHSVYLLSWKYIIYTLRDIEIHPFLWYKNGCISMSQSVWS